MAALWVRRGVVALLGVAVAVALWSAAAGASTGIDVSNWQHPNGAPIDWGAVRASGQSFVFIKATEGPGRQGGGYFTNPYFAGDWAGAGSVGMLRGAYHYAQPRYPLDTAVADARHFVSVTGTMRAVGDLPPVLDLEDNRGLPPADYAAWAKSWLWEVERLTGRRPIVYSGYYFFNSALAGDPSFTAYRLWMPRYTSAPDPYPLPGAWTTWTFWQWSSTGSVPGIAAAVDLNRYCCADGNLAALADGSGSQAASNPFGSAEFAERRLDGIRVTGWMIDPDTTGPTDVHVYVDGGFAGAGTTGSWRPDVGAAYPGWGDAHGFDVVVPAGPGQHQVCVYGINNGPGSANPLLGCRTVAGDPSGSFDRVVPSGSGQVTAYGWAADPDAGTGAIDVHVYVDGVAWTAGTANRPRPDVGAAFPPVGPDHGFEIPVGGLTAGPHRLCSYAINWGSGTNRFLGCVDAQVLGGTPFGALDHVIGGPWSARVLGWTVDPDTAGPISVAVKVDGKPALVTPADRSRPDVAAAFPAFGPGHGLDVVVPGLIPGDHTVCVDAFNVGVGVNASMGCRLVRVPWGDPWGALDLAASSGPGRLRVAGWSIDPESDAPVAIDVRLNPADAATAASTSSLSLATAVPAGVPRPDVAAAFLAFGPGHGFDLDVGGLPSGRYTVCVTARNVGIGVDRSLGCRPVELPGAPVGNLDELARAGTTMTVRGWALDPDTTDHLAVHVYVDGVGVAVLAADGDRGDIADAFPGYGAAHGFTGTVTVAPGPHTVCAYAINVGQPAANTGLGCRQG